MNINGVTSFKGNVQVKTWEKNKDNGYTIRTQNFRTTPNQDQQIKYHTTQMKDIPETDAELLGKYSGSALINGLYNKILGTKIYDSQQPKELYTNLRDGAIRLRDGGDCDKGVDILFKFN